MSKTKLLSVIPFLVLAFSLCIPATGSAQFVTIARKIKSKMSGDKEVASVVLDAGPAKVYKAMIDTLTAQPKVKITKKDNPKRTVEFTKDDYSITMKVDSVAVNFAEISVVATQEGNASKKETDVAINAILGVCHKVGLHCDRKDQ